jgi:hypothetical protein
VCFVYKGFLCFSFFFSLSSAILEHFFFCRSIILLCQIALTFITFAYTTIYIAKLNALGWVCTNNVEFLVSADFIVWVSMGHVQKENKISSGFGSFRGEVMGPRF